MVAFLNGNVQEACELFIQGRVDISVKDSIQSSLLHWAIFFKLKPIVAKLIDYQCDVDHKNDLNETPLLIACQEAALPILDVLLDKGEGRDPRTLPGDLDSQDLERGQSALLWCVRHQNLIAAEKLVELGCNVNLRDNDGTAALHVAVFLRNVELTRLLLFNKADPNFESHKWKTPLKMAMDSGHMELTDLLLDHGAKTIRGLELSASLSKFDHPINN